jgi:hypothetical protein
MLGKVAQMSLQRKKLLQTGKLKCVVVGMVGGPDATIARIFLQHPVIAVEPLADDHRLIAVARDAFRGVSV